LTTITRFPNSPCDRSPSGHRNYFVECPSTMTFIPTIADGASSHILQSGKGGWKIAAPEAPDFIHPSAWRTVCFPSDVLRRERVPAWHVWWTCCAGRAGAYLRSDAAQRAVSIGRPVAYRAGARPSYGRSHRMSRGAARLSQLVSFPLTKTPAKVRQTCWSAVLAREK
jgi:hypothetical protein